MCSVTSSLRLELPAIAAAVMCCLAPLDGHAVPAFARKYRTSCQTCHTSFPRLTPFGEAFRLGGYQYPEDDLKVQKGRPLELGSEKYKDVFPDAVWPGRIQESVPLALRVQGAVKFNATADADVVDDFDFPAVATLNFAGTLSEDISLWFGAHLSVDGQVGIDKAVFILSNLFSNVGVPRHLLNVRAGQFEPEAQPFSAHRSPTLSALAFSGFRLTRWLTSPGGGTATAHAHLEAAKADTGHDATHTAATTPAPATTDAAATATTTPIATGTATGAATISGGTPMFGLDRGIELYGIIAKRVLYAIGVFNGTGASAPVNGNLDTNSGKDVTGRLQWKIGGMGLDGSGEVDAKNWREWSGAIGAFVRWGKNHLTRVESTGTSRSYDSTLLRVGGDVNVRLSDVELTAAVVWETQSNPGGDEQRFNALGWIGEVHVVWLPWLQSTVRYEAVGAGEHYAIAEQQLVASVAFVVRPNVKAIVEGAIDLRKPESFSHGTHTVFLGLDAAF